MDTQKLMKYGATAGFSAGLFHFMHSGSYESVNLFGKELPLWAVGAALGLSSNILSDVAHQMLFSHLSTDTKFAKIETAATSALAGGGGYVIAAHLMNASLVSEAGGLFPLLIQGAVLEIVSSYLYENSIEPFIM